MKDQGSFHFVSEIERFLERKLEALKNIVFELRNLIEEVQKLKQGDGPSIVISGSGTIVAQEAGLINARAQVFALPAFDLFELPLLDASLV
jgi:4-diphosphocytidyl-2C-methyl-D-erythritol kinase